MPVDPEARRALAKFADRLSAIEKTARRNRRTGQGAYRSVEGGGHAFFDADGNLVAQIGLQPDGTYGVQAVNGGSVVADAARREAVDADAVAVSPLGGAFANLIHDPGFIDAAFRSNRLAGDTDEIWSFRQNVRAFTDEKWTPGPHIILKANAEAGYGGEGRLAYANGLNPGDLFGTYTATCTGNALPGASTLINGGIEPMYATGSYTVVVDWLDENGGVIASESHTLTLDPSPDDVTPDCPVTVPETAPAAIRATYTLGADLADVHGDGSAAPWTSDTSYGALYDFSVNFPDLPSPFGPAITWGEWFAEATIPDDTTRTLTITKPFPVAPGLLYATQARVQQVDAPDAPDGVELVFYDADGNEVPDPRPATSWAASWAGVSASPVYPDWALTTLSLRRAPVGAVSAAVRLSASGPGTSRIRAPKVSVAGWEDKGELSLAYVGPSSLAFLQGNDRLFSVDVTFDAARAWVHSQGIFQQTGSLYVQGGAGISPYFLVAGLIEANGADGTVSIGKAGGGGITLADTAAGDYLPVTTDDPGGVFVRSTERLDFTTEGYVDIPGMTVTVTSPGPDAVYVIQAGIDARNGGGTTAVMAGNLLVDDAGEDGQIILAAPVAGFRGTVAQRWRITGLAAGEHTFKVSGGIAPATGVAGSSWTIYDKHTTMLVSRLR